jgi:hypothetical protein
MPLCRPCSCSISGINAVAKQPLEAARSFSNGSGWWVSSRQANGELSERARLVVDLDRATMLLHNDVIADREPETGAFTRRLGFSNVVRRFPV